MTATGCPYLNDRLDDSDHSDAIVGHTVQVVSEPVGDLVVDVVGARLIV